MSGLEVADTPKYTPNLVGCQWKPSNVPGRQVHRKPMIFKMLLEVSGRPRKPKWCLRRATNVQISELILKDSLAAIS